MSSDRVSREGAALCALVTDLRPCLDGAASARHGEILERFRAFVSLVEDLLGREGARRAAAEAEAKLAREVVQELKTIVWMADAETGHYSFVSGYAEEALGYPIGRWLADPAFWSHFVHPEDRAYVAANRSRCCREGKDVEFEYRALTASDRVVWFRETIRLAPAAELRGQIWDITRRKKVERQLYTARRELAEQLDDMKYLHEMGTRLSPLMGLRPLIGEILAAVMGIQGAEMGLIGLDGTASGEIDVAASRGLPDEYLAKVARLRPGALLGGAALAAGKSVVVEDTETDPHYAPDPGLARLGGYRAASGTPIIAQDGKLLGIIATHFREPHRPTQRQTRLVELYSRQVAVFIQVAGLVEQVAGLVKQAGMDGTGFESAGRGDGDGHARRASSATDGG